jgi:two-component sensor histidine kinase/ligand-binding sensor domain-containing protein
VKWQFLISALLILWDSFGQNLPIPEGLEQNVTIKKHKVDWNDWGYADDNYIDTVLTNVQTSRISGFKFISNGRLKSEELKVKSYSSKVIDGLIERDNAILNISYLTKKNGLQHKGLHSLDIDDENNLYLANGNHFSVFNGKIIQIYELPDSVKGIQDVIYNKGRVWLSSASGLFYFEEGKFYVVDQLYAIPIAVVSIDRSGTIWVSTDKHGLYKIDSEDELYSVEHPRLKTYLKKVYQDSKGTRWIAFQEGVIKMNERDTILFDYGSEGYEFPICFIENKGRILVGGFLGGLTMIDGNSVYQLEMGVENNSIHDIKEVNGIIWMAVFGKGVIAILKNREYVLFNSDFGLPNNSAHKLCIDSYGQIWASNLNFGLLRIAEENFLPAPVLYNSTQILSSKASTSVRFYFRTHGGILRLKNDLFQEMIIPKTFGRVPYHKDGDVLDSNHIWLQSYDGGFVQYTSNQFISHQHDEYEMEYQTHTPVQDKWGRVWATKYYGDVKYLKGDKVYNLSAVNDDFKRSNGFVKTGNKDCYYSKGNRLYLIRENDFRQINLPEGIIKAIFHEKNGGLWVLKENGLYKILHEKYEKVSALNELRNLGVYGGIENHDYLYFSLKNKILKWDPSSRTVVDSFPVGYLFEGGKLVDGQRGLMFTSEAGNLRFIEGWNRRKSIKPKLQLKKVTIDGVKSKNRNLFKLNPQGKLKLYLDFDCLQANQQIEYTLINDKAKANWNLLSKSFISLENLAPGDYTLKVRNKLENNESTILQFSISVSPYWYQSNLFFALIGVLLLSIVYIGFRMRVKSLNARKEKLEELVKEKTKEIEQKKNQVEVELKAKEVLLKEVNHRVKNNMQMVSSILELQKSKNKNLEGKEAIDIAIKRVKALSIAHQHLYQGGDYQNIYIDDYLQVILDNVTSQADVQISSDLVKIKFDIEKAQALGLILNELIQNSLKYAWPMDAKDKEIEVRLQRVQDGFKFSYNDNGIGIDTSKKSIIGLGKTLMKAIVSRQLEGDYTESFEDGYGLVINFNLDHEENINR